jgi:NADH-quinone oxidoreductase subunit L
VESAEGEPVVTVNGLPLADHEAVADPDFHPHESGPEMTIPLVVLAVLSAVGWLINAPGWHLLETWLEPITERGLRAGEVEWIPNNSLKLIFAAMSALVAAAGIMFARSVFSKGDRAAEERYEPEILQRAWGYDAAVTAFMGGPGRAAFDAIVWFDRTVVDGAVNGTGVVVRGLGRGLRRLQSGFVRSYAVSVALGAVVVIAFMAIRVLEI